MMSLLRNVILIFSILLSLMLNAQKDTTHKKSFKSQRIFGFQVQYQKHFPMADFKKTTGTFSDIGGGVFYKSNANFQFGVQAGYLYGSNIKDYSTLNPITTSKGTIIDINGYEDYPSLIFKGFTGNFYVGKLFTFNRNKNSGLMVQLGLGYLRHKMVLSNTSRGITQLEGDKKDGYQRMVGGMNITSFAGWQHISMKRAFNFVVGFTYDNAITNPISNYDYASKGKLPGKRKDSMFGIKAGWIIPIFLQNKGQEDFYFY